VQPSLSDEQITTLLRPLNPTRVAKRSQANQELSYLEAYDVRAHAIRVFGFGQFSVETLDVVTMYEELVQPPVTDKLQRSPKPLWHVAVRAIVRLTIHQTGAVYTEAAVGGSQQPSHVEALDMATKTAVSDAMKRAFINLGDQFGLSLYDRGSTAPVVRGLVHMPEAPKQDEKKSEGGPVDPGSQKEEPREGQGPDGEPYEG
jgi:recombination DNA repair RAD52 pathway protein